MKEANFNVLRVCDIGDYETDDLCYEKKSIYSLRG